MLGSQADDLTVEPRAGHATQGWGACRGRANRRTTSEANHEAGCCGLISRDRKSCFPGIASFGSPVVGLLLSGVLSRNAVYPKRRIGRGDYRGGSRAVGRNLPRKRDADVLVAQLRYCAVRQSTYRPSQTTPHFWTAACCFDDRGRIELMRGVVTDACADEERLVVNGGRKAETFEGCGCVGPSRNWPMVRLATWKSSSRCTRCDEDADRSGGILAFCCRVVYLHLQWCHYLPLAGGAGPKFV